MLQDIMLKDKPVGYLIATLRALGYEEDEIRRAAYEMLKQIQKLSDEEIGHIIDNF